MGSDEAVLNCYVVLTVRVSVICHIINNGESETNYPWNVQTQRNRNNKTVICFSDQLNWIASMLLYFYEKWFYFPFELCRESLRTD